MYLPAQPVEVVRQNIVDLNFQLDDLESAYVKI